MPKLMLSIENEIARNRHALDDWLKDAYSGIENLCYYGEMDASFPNWSEI
jgi:hypothetical protein